MRAGFFVSGGGELDCLSWSMRGNWIFIAFLIARECGKDLTGEGPGEAIVGEAKRFSGEIPQGDDQTVVVLNFER